MTTKDTNYPEELEKVQKLAQEYLAGWQRAKADFINYKKEQTEAMGAVMLMAHEHFIKKLLPVLDSFDEAGKHKTQDKGLKTIHEQMLEILKKDGVEIIDKQSISFDPRIHEAIGEAKGDVPDMVAEVLQKGYKLNGKVLRPARVTITK